MLLSPGKFVRQAWDETRNDTRNARWNGVLVGKIFLSLTVLIWATGLVAIPIVLALLQQITGSSRVACTPDGQFNLNPGHYSYWSRTGFFQITLTFGELSFENAKLIDVAWDVVSNDVFYRMRIG